MLLGLAIVVLSFLTLVFSQALFDPLHRGFPKQPGPLPPPDGPGGVHLVWMALELSLLLLVCWATDRRSARRGDGPFRRLITAIIASGSTGALISVGLWAHARGSTTPFPFPFTLVGGMVFGFVRGLVACGLWALAFIYPVAVEAERWRSETELARLRTHLEPHFLLNTLNTIAGLVTENPAEARRLIVTLGDLLRSDFTDANARHTIHDEIDWLQRYASIFESRHRGALRFAWEVSTDTTHFLIPRFLLQPLVENAIKHGALRRPDGVVTVSIFSAGHAVAGGVTCVVEDNGFGLGSDPPRPGAFGLVSVRRRLALECPGSRFRLDSSPTGTRARIELVAASLRSGR